MTSWWSQVIATADKRGWGPVIGIWFLMLTTFMGLLVWARIILWAWWQLSGQTPPSELLDL